MSIVRKGQTWQWMGCDCLVTRVAEDGSWADLQVTAGPRNVSGIRSWTKRQKLPLPDSAVLVLSGSGEIVTDRMAQAEEVDMGDTRKPGGHCDVATVIVLQQLVKEIDAEATKYDGSLVDGMHAAADIARRAATKLESDMLQHKDAAVSSVVIPLRAQRLGEYGHNETFSTPERVANILNLASPVIVATELRRLASLGRVVFTSYELRDIADEIDPGGADDD